jgi:hypothetical protein
MYVKYSKGSILLIFAVSTMLMDNELESAPFGVLEKKFFLHTAKLFAKCSALLLLIFNLLSKM